jgi:hypothetical protein
VSGVELPAYLTTPPAGRPPDPPVVTRKQKLPYGELAWPDFERLCARVIAKRSDVEDARIYGGPGEKQEGIDILAHGTDGTVSAYQCRRVKAMGAARIEQAVADFLNDSWGQRAETFAICTSTNLGSTARSKEVERQREVLKKRGKRLETLDEVGLSLVLKDYPDLVDDFFGRPWVALFNGQNAAEDLGAHLDLASRRATREDLAKFYREVFSVHDAGLSLAPAAGVRPADLRDLFNSPDILEDVRSAAVGAQPDADAEAGAETQAAAEGQESPGGPDAVIRQKKASHGSRAELRIPSETWLGPQRRAIVAGYPGAGKSSLLRFLALDLLAEEPRFTSLSWDWGSPIPIWIPFGRWTELIAEGKRSLVSLAETWLEELGRPELAPLYEKALEDGRAVLLVDGLDEWKTEAAALIALDELRIYVGERDLRAIATTRPNAFQQLGEPPGDWAACRLAALDTDQQHDVIERLLAWAASAENEGRIPKSAFGARQFVEELSKTPDLRELAAIPLTLVFLHWIRTRDAQLPRDRFQAYAALVDLLLDRYPAKRTAATGIVGDISPMLREEDARLALGRVALALHESGGVEIAKLDATAAACSLLVDEEIGPGLPQADAKRLAAELLDHSMEKLGLVLELPGSGNLAFLHRSVQEHLCASYLARTPLADQKRFIEERGIDPRWKEVILNLLHLTVRPGEVDELVEALRELRRQAGWDEGDPLMAEIGVGRFGCSSRLAGELVEDAATECETFARPSVSIPIGLRLIEGLEGRRGEGAMHQRIRGWLAPQPWSLSGLLAGMQEWAEDSGVDRLLFRACFSAEVKDARCAADTLTERCRARGEKPSTLLDALERPLTLSARAAILESLARHWPQEPRVKQDLLDCRASRCAELKLVSIASSVRHGTHDKDDLAELLQVACEDSGIDREWRSTLIDTLIEGWTRDPRLKQACLEDIQAGRRPYEGLDHGLAEVVLLEAFPEDPDAVRYAVAQIDGERFPFLTMRQWAWRVLARNFADSPELVAAADKWIVEQNFHQPEVSFGALIGRTEVAKGKLLEDLRNSSLPFWAARSLLEGWGVSDGEVREALVDVARGEASQASMIAHFFPRLPLGRSYVGDRLVALLEDTSVPRGDLIMQAALELEDPELNDRILHPALVALERGRSMGWDILGYLIRLAPEDDRVRSLALDSLRQREPPWFSLAQTYGGDEEIRGRLIEHAAPLSTQNRSRGWQALAPLAERQTSVASMAASYPVEFDAPTATTMARAWARSAGTGEQRETMVDAAVAELHGGAPSWEGHAQAGLAVLLELERLDAYSRAEPFGEEKRFTVPLADYLNLNVEIASSVVDHWDEIVEEFGMDYASVFRGLGKDSDEDFWEAIAPVADRNPKSRAALLEQLRERKSLSGTELSFLARTQPRTPGLLERCMQALGGESQRLSDPGLIACEILAEQFSGDDELGERLLTEFEQTHSQLAFVALAEGWTSGPFRRALQHANDRGFKMPYELIWRVHICHPDPQTAISGIDGFIEHGWRSDSWLVDAPVRLISKRLSGDPKVAAKACEKLTASDAAPSDSATYSRLLSKSIGVSEEIRGLLEDRRLGASGREIGVDIVAGARRPVAHAIGDALELN